ncbi:MAG: hypothetical protein ACO21J_09350, partial [Anaerohalosphaeraceae bacterium]
DVSLCYPVAILGGFGIIRRLGTIQKNGLNAKNCDKCLLMKQKYGSRPATAGMGASASGVRSTSPKAARTAVTAAGAAMCSLWSIPRWTR